MRLRFLSLCLALFASVFAVHAFGQGGTIANGQEVSGHLSGTSQIDNWTFTLNATPVISVWVCFSLDYPQGSATYEENFKPVISVPASGGFGAQAKASPVCTAYVNPSGSYQVSVYNASPAPDDPTIEGDYVLKLTFGGYPFIVSGYGGDVTNGTYKVTESGDLFDIWAFAANAGDNLTFSLGGVSSQSRLCILPLDGGAPENAGAPGAGYCFNANGPTLSFSPTSGGTYVLLTSAAAPHGIATNYSLTVSGSSTPPSAAAKSNGAYCQKCSQGGFAAGDPVNVATGNLFEDLVDYQSPGPNKLTLERYYNSAENTFNLHPTLLGSNWRTNYDRYLRVGGPGTMVAERADGQVITFVRQQSGKYLPDSDINLTLTDTDGGGIWSITDTDNTVEYYNLSNLIGYYQGLFQINYRNGYIQVLQYQGTAQSRVVDSYNRILALPTDTSGHLTSITAPDGSMTKYGYTTTGNSSLLTTVQHPTSTETYTYLTGNQSFLLTSVLDGLKQTYARWQYDGNNRVISSQHGTMGQPGDGAGKVTFKYNADGSRQLTNALGQAETYKFTTLQSVPKLTEVDRGSLRRTQSYDSNGFLSGFTDFKGNKTAITNNVAGLPTSIVKAAGQSGLAQTTTIAYDQRQVNQPASIAESGVNVTYTYDGAGNVLTKTLTDTTADPVPPRTYTYTYQQLGGAYLLSTATGPRTDVTAITTYGYDSDTGFLNKMTDALGHVTQYGGFTGSGQPTTITDPNGVVTTVAYDQQQRVISSSIATAAGPRKTTFTYDAAGNLTNVALPDSSFLTYAYDTAHRVTKITDALGNAQNLTLNAFGEPTTTSYTDPAGSARYAHAGSYDSLGRLLTDTTGSNGVTTYTYDDNGNAVTIVDPDNHPAVSQVFDALNRRTQVTDSANGITKYVYNTQNLTTEVQTPNGASTAYTYDGFGDLLQTVSPDSGTTIYSYDTAGNLAQKTDASGAITNYTYDALNRVLTKTYPGDPAENVTYSYDQPGHGFGIGRLTSMTDQLGTLGRSYDERGNLLAESRQLNGFTATTAYTYDAASRLSSISYPSGTKAIYSRDIAGQVASVATQGGIVAAGVTHLPFGPVSGFTFGNGIADARTFDLAYRMTGLTDRASGSPATQALAYGYDPANNVKTITNGVRPYLSQTLGYDALDRLNSAAATDYGSFAWMYDANGNRTMESRGPASVPTGYGYTPASNRLASLSIGDTVTQTYSYTPTGHLAGVVDQRGSTVAGAVYNQADRLVASTGYGQIIAEYGYDGFGQRLGKFIPGATTTGVLFQYGQDGNLLEEADLTGAVKADYIYLDGVPIGDLVPATHALAYLHTDHLGTPQLATDSGKSLVWGAAYYPFGGTSYLAGAITQNLRLPGQYFDAETQAYHNGFRDYAPGFGRYVESDPIGLQGGQASTYTYARSNPNQFVDPLGLQLDYASPATDEENNQEEITHTLEDAGDKLNDDANQAIGNANTAKIEQAVNSGNFGFDTTGLSPADAKSFHDYQDANSSYGSTSSPQVIGPACTARDPMGLGDGSSVSAFKQPKYTITVTPGTIQIDKDPRDQNEYNYSVQNNY